MYEKEEVVEEVKPMSSILTQMKSLSALKFKNTAAVIVRYRTVDDPAISSRDKIDSYSV